MSLIDAILEVKMHRVTQEIDDKMLGMWMTLDNAKDYCVDIKKDNLVDTYTVYKKEFVWIFQIDMS